MKSFLKYLGIILQLVGVVVLAVPFFMKMETNAGLLVGWALVVVGFLAYLIINKYMD